MISLYPTLGLLDQALDNPLRPFSESPDAAALEVHARELAADFWSDTVWVTGIVSAAALHRVREELERRRCALEALRPTRAEIRLVIVGSSAHESRAPAAAEAESSWLMPKAG